MRKPTIPLSLSLCLSGALGFVSLAGVGCGSSTAQSSNVNPGGKPDLTIVSPSDDDSGTGTDDGSTGPNACGDTDPTCASNGFDPTTGMKFPLSGDKPPDPNAGSDGLGPDKNGYLILTSTHANYIYAWTANTDDWNLGTVSKWDTTKVREVARYFTVTCNSLPGGNKMDCNGMAKTGCCAYDSYPQYTNRKAGMAAGPAQQVELKHQNNPSRTAVDFDGSVWVANRALYQTGAQSSVSKIANDLASCKDYNRNGRIDTSKDVNGDGIIQTDCNGDGKADDIAGVKAMPCTNGLAQEFYGLDDECIVVTTNTGGLDAYGRPLALGPGAKDNGPSDVWAGLFNTKQVFRIEGQTGLIKDMLTLPCQPYGFVIDSFAIGWAANLGAAGCYWNTKDTTKTGTIRTYNGQSSYGIALDRDQNIWFGSTAARYSPDRKKQFVDLGNGSWTLFTGIYGSGVAVDSRTAKTYFAYYAGSKLYQVPATMFPPIMGQDQTIDGSKFPGVAVFGGSGKGAGITQDGNVMVTSGGQAGIQRVKVDAMGVMAQPDLNSPAMGNNKCPTGDFCVNTDHGPMQPYTYSDFTGFGLRNFTQPKGFWSYIVKGCTDNQGNPADTKWLQVRFTATVPPSTQLTVKARSGNTPMPDNTWGAWTVDQKTSPADLTGTLTPNAVNMMTQVKDGYLQIEFDLQTTDKTSSPALQSIAVDHECPGIIP